MTEAPRDDPAPRPDWPRLKALFDEAQALTPEARAAWLQAQGLDSATRAELDSLLAHHAAAETAGPHRGDYLRSASPPEVISLAPGHRLGAWATVRRIGAGGMGEVYEARRADGAYEGRAAVKLLKRGMDSAAVLERFARERQALARLVHPHIATLLDAGASEEGLPYFVMEHVDGQPIDVAARGRPLEARLQLFLQLADAVAHAHRKLLVHRDLKPGNVLVNGEGQVKLLDFGIAKALDPLEDAGAAGATVGGVRPYTPNYASPEQVRGEPVSTATDIYSLGVLLYEMLTGLRPTGRGATTPADAARGVLEDTPTRPSRLSPQDTQDPQWLATRKRLEGDLDNILLKALEKAPDQRYASVEALAADVRAFLAGYPVSARAPRPLYLLRKFVSRNRAVVTVAALGAVALTGGLVATTWQWQRAEREHAAAERRFAQVRELANRLLFEYHDAIHLLPGSTAVRERMLKDAREHLQSLAAEAAGQPRLQRELGVAYRRLGELYHAEARPALGDVQTSLQLIAQGRALLEQAAAAEPADASTRYQLALAQVAVARSQRSAGQPRLALAPLEQAAALFDALAAEQPREAAYRIEQVRTQLHLSEVFGAGSTAELADSARARAHLDKATGQVDAVLRDLPDDPDAVALYCTVHNLRWLSEANAGRYEAGLDILRSLVPVFVRLQALAPDDTLFRRDAAVNFLSQGTALMRLQRWDEARAASAEALRRMQAIAAADPANRVTQRDVAKLLGDVAWSDFKLGHGPLAAAGFAQAIDSLEALARHDPRDRRVARLLALAHGQRAEVQAAGGQAGDVARHLERALALAAAQRAASPDDVSSAVLQAQLQTQAGLSWATLPGGTLRSCPPFRDALAAWQALDARGQMRAGDRPRLEQARAGAARCGP